jgi:uncharacterized membrane protein
MLPLDKAPGMRSFTFVAPFLPFLPTLGAWIFTSLAVPLVVELHGLLKTRPAAVDTWAGALILLAQHHSGMRSGCEPGLSRVRMLIAFVRI